MASVLSRAFSFTSRVLQSRITLSVACFGSSYAAFKCRKDADYYQNELKKQQCLNKDLLDVGQDLKDTLGPRYQEDLHLVFAEVRKLKEQREKTGGFKSLKVGVLGVTDG